MKYKRDLYERMREEKIVCICMAMACASHPRIQMLTSLDSNGIKIYVAQRKLAVAAYKSNELHPA